MFNDQLTMINKLMMALRDQQSDTRRNRVSPYPNGIEHQPGEPRFLAAGFPAQPGKTTVISEPRPMTILRAGINCAFSAPALAAVRGGHLRRGRRREPTRTADCYHVRYNNQQPTTSLPRKQRLEQLRRVAIHQFVVDGVEA